MPGQLVFGRDMILPIQFKANWARILQRKKAPVFARSVFAKSGWATWRLSSTEICACYDVPEHLVKRNLENLLTSCPVWGRFQPSYLGPLVKSNLG
jgi:hypothetical protein